MTKKVMLFISVISSIYIILNAEAYKLYVMNGTELPVILIMVPLVGILLIGFFVKNEKIVGIVNIVFGGAFTFMGVKMIWNEMQYGDVIINKWGIIKLIREYSEEERIKYIKTYIEGRECCMNHKLQYRRKAKIMKAAKEFMSL